jgi:hypothetical protein
LAILGVLAILVNIFSFFLHFLHRGVTQLGVRAIELFYSASRSWRKRVGHTDRHTDTHTEFLKYRQDPPAAAGLVKSSSIAFICAEKINVNQNLPKGE